MSTISREIPPRAERQRARRLSYADVRHRLVWVALIGTSLMSYAATAGFVVAAMQPSTFTGWLIALAVATVGEALLIVSKAALRDDSRDGLGWVAAGLDMATNTAGVYWWAPGIAMVPGIATLIGAIGIDPASALARTLVAAFVGFILSAAPVWLLPIALDFREQL